MPVPSLNDDAVHYLVIQRASEALAQGDNIVDHWLPEFELGFPMFFYYQHLPHLTVVALHRLLFQQVDLLTVFNAVRYFLLVGFPLTVYWSMRRLEFSVVAAAVGAASASLISSNHRYGFEYDSYIWRGHGMYTQLWSMHLSFLVLACLYRLLERGTGYVAAVISCSLLALSHLIYAYMMALTVLVLFLMRVGRSNWRALFGRLAITGVFAAVISSYMSLPFLFQKAFLSASPYLQRWKYDSFGAGEILTWLVNGDLLDYDRLPVLTVLLALGLALAIFSRSRPARMALVLFVVWLLLYFGRPTWGHILDVLPMHDALLLHRFIGSLDVAVILLIGLGGEWLWHQSARLPERWRAAAVALVVLLLLLPALRERQRFYSFNTQWIERTRRAVDGDADARAILAELRKLPPGRAYAGLRADWGKDLQFGDLHFRDLLTFNRVMAALPPYSSLSLNADIIWHFNDHNPAHYNLLNVKYVVAPRSLRVAEFLRPIKETPRYVLYRVETHGYTDFVAVAARKSPRSQSDLFFQNRDWFLSAEPAAQRFIRYDYPPHRGAAAEGAKPDAAAERGCPEGKIADERIWPGRIDLSTECQTAATLVLKLTYHPNWRVAVDGREVKTFMISPSFIGFDLPAGVHQVRAEYRASLFKNVLLLAGACALLALFCFKRRLTELDARLSAKGRRRR